MICSKTIRQAHEDIQNKLFVMLPEKWDKLCLYASVIDHFNQLQTGEMFFYYYPRGVLKKRPVNVYEVPTKFNIDERAYNRMADELYGSIKKLREYCIEEGDKPWTNITIIIEKAKYRVEYCYDDLDVMEFDSNAMHIIWAYKYLDTPYESLNKDERKIISDYERARKKPIKVFELPLYDKEINKRLEKIQKDDRKLEFVTEEKIQEMEFRNTHVPKSQILK